MNLLKQLARKILAEELTEINTLQERLMNAAERLQERDAYIVRLQIKISQMKGEILKLKEHTKKQPHFKYRAKKGVRK